MLDKRPPRPSRWVPVSYTVGQPRQKVHHMVKSHHHHHSRPLNMLPVTTEAGDCFLLEEKGYIPTDEAQK